MLLLAKLIPLPPVTLSARVQPPTICASVLWNFVRRALLLCRGTPPANGSMALRQSLPYYTVTLMSTLPCLFRTKTGLVSIVRPSWLRQCMNLCILFLHSSLACSGLVGCLLLSMTCMLSPRNVSLCSCVLSAPNRQLRPENALAFLLISDDVRNCILAFSLLGPVLFMMCRRLIALLRLKWMKRLPLPC